MTQTIVCFISNLQQFPKLLELTKFEFDFRRVLIDFVEQYGIDVRPEKVFDWEDIQQAHAYLEIGESFGKAIVRLENKERE